MGGRTAIVLVTLLVAGCARRYWVRPSHLERARAREEAVIPAADHDGDATYVEVDAIDYVDPPDPTTGLQNVEVMDASPALKIGGWVAVGIGIAGLASMADSGSDGEIRLPVALILTGAGALSLALGYFAFDPEAGGPSPGMPATLRDP